MGLNIENFLNDKLAPGASKATAFLRVTASDLGSIIKVTPTGKCYNLLIDVSRSMDEKCRNREGKPIRTQKIDMAKKAAKAFINTLDENSKFCIIIFADYVQTLVEMTTATLNNKQYAYKLIDKLEADGGTKMSLALNEVLAQIEKLDGYISFCELVTDGENFEDDNDALKKVLKKCEGKFICNCWGLGTKYDTSQLKKISDALLGKTDAVVEPEKLEDYFRESLAEAQAVGIADAYLRLEFPQSTKIVRVEQSYPEKVDRLPMTIKKDLCYDVPLGALSDGNRDFLLAFDVEPLPVGKRRMALRPSVVYSDGDKEIIIPGPPIVVSWSNNRSETSRIDPKVATAEGLGEVATLIEQAMEAQKTGNTARTEKLLGTAREEAEKLGHNGTVKLIDTIGTYDKGKGTVRLKAGNTEAAQRELEARGSRTMKI